MRSSASRVTACAAVLTLLASCVVLSMQPARGDDQSLREIGEFRPFGPHNKIGNFQEASAVDVQRRTWFFAVTSDPKLGGQTPVHVWQFDLDRQQLVGEPAVLPGPEPYAAAFGLDEATGNYFTVYEGVGGEHIGVVAPSPSGPKVIGDWALGAHLAATAGRDPLIAKGMDVFQGKIYLAAIAQDALDDTPETVLLQIDIARLLAGQDAFDWRYKVAHCPKTPGYNGPVAIGRSQYAPTIAVPCSAKSSTDLQGVVLIAVGSGDDPSKFTERLFPIGGDFSQGDTFFDRKSNRIALRRVGPAELVTFDVTHERWLPRIQFGQNNLYQWAFDDTTGRIYGYGNDSGNNENLYVPELRTTPPQNGLTLRAYSPTPGSELVPKGVLAYDPVTRRLYLSDFDATTAADPVTGIPTKTSDGVFFHVYQEGRPPVLDDKVANPDSDIINFSGEGQGYGARISYIGGFGNTYSNAVNPAYPLGTVLARGSRHVSFARTNHIRMADGEASAEAIGAYPEGSMQAELTEAGQPWPYTAANCSDYEDKATNDSQPGATVSCTLSKHEAKSAAVYQADTSNPYNAPVQRAQTTASLSLDPKLGVVTDVESEASLDIPGVLHIGRIWAHATTSAAGANGTALHKYERAMEDVDIAGQPFCKAQCDINAVATAINTQFANTTSAGIQIVAYVPNADPNLVGSPGGAQAIIQRDFWDHEEDLLLHEGADDRFELPAFSVAIYQDRKYPEHEVYWLAGVQAASRFPRALAPDLEEIFNHDAHDTTPPLVVQPPDPPNIEGGGTEPAPIIGGGKHGIVHLGRTTRIVRRLAWTLRSPLRSVAVLALLAFLLAPVFLSSRRSHFMTLRRNAGES